MKRPKKFYIVAVSVLFGATALFSLPDVVGKYNLEKQGNAFRVQFPVLPDEQLTIMNRFTKILNGEVECNLTIGGKTYTNSYDALIAAFDNSPTKYSSSEQKYITLHNNSYIGSMQTGEGEDVTALTTLFGGILESQGSAYSLMLKRDPLDGEEVTGEGYYLSGDHGWIGENQYYKGAEMALFSTSETLYPVNNSKYPTVYVTVFTKYPKLDQNGKEIQARNADGALLFHNEKGEVVTDSTGVYPIYETGDWEVIGSYTGTAQNVKYSTNSRVGSFDTGTWKSSEVYGTAAIGSTLPTVVQETKKNWRA